MNITKIDKWPIENTGRPLLVAGPCSAESEEQLLEIAKGLKEIGVEIFRAGVWKPRTRPNSFEGMGEKALVWLQKVKEQFGMKLAVEVANAKHVEMALNAGVDMLWIGARTTVNPFAVQEISDALESRDIPVFVKNPINPDLELWIGAIERLQKAGITKIAAIHRGFSSYRKIRYRNEPQWQIPIELKRRIPDLPLIVDPSHISGDVAFIQEIIQKAMDLNYDGMIVESHNNPAVALSDAKQQVTPDALGTIMSELILRSREHNSENLNDNLSELRDMIDDFDEQLLDLLENRMQIAKTIGQYKKENNITVLQNKRWDQILQKNINRGKTKGLSEHFISTVFKAIHQESINNQENIMND
ncbi:MAG: bifunctional 3-deoxy-7-phosphoheptulonate synthase/chorismate mutase type II [Marinifilaceae bacterium]|jgi:chorismate mutase|nr:bifunctional 3-deoxy-7-phosphoheptulonate synthase/chorismate mutase type II [Marinifilaceae bacterium]